MGLKAGCNPYTKHTRRRLHCRKGVWPRSENLRLARGCGRPVKRGLDAVRDSRRDGIKERYKMHYRNGREAKNGDKIVRLGGENRIEAFGVLHSSVPGNDYCNGSIAIVQQANEYACLCDCLHVDDVAGLIIEKGIGKRPAGK